MVTKTDQVLSLARRLLALETEAAAVRKELDALVEGDSKRQLMAPEPRRRTPRPATAVAGGDVQAVVLSLVMAEPSRQFRAADLRELLPGRPGKNSVESALQRLMGTGQLERTGRGLYQAPRQRP
jgi:hypothetical protein